MKRAIVAGLLAGAWVFGSPIAFFLLYHHLRVAPKLPTAQEVRP